MWCCVIFDSDTVSCFATYFTIAPVYIFMKCLILSCILKYKAAVKTLVFYHDGQTEWVILIFFFVFFFIRRSWFILMQFEWCSVILQMFLSKARHSQLGRDESHCQRPLILLSLKQLTYLTAEKWLRARLGWSFIRTGACWKIILLIPLIGRCLLWSKKHFIWIHIYIIHYIS